MLFLFLRNLHFSPEFLVMQKNGLKKKAMATLKMFDFTDRTTNNYNTQITPNISRSYGNQAMTFGRLIKQSMRNNYFQKLCRK